MNAFALHSEEEFGSRACEANSDDDYRLETLAGFAPKSHVRVHSNRAVGIAAVAVVHGLLALGFVFAAPRFYKAADHQMTVVSIVPEVERKIDPPPMMPVFEPPAVYIPQPITPEIILATPPPPNAITVAPAPPAPVVQAPIVQTPPPVIGKAVEPPPISAADRKEFAAKLFGHLNRYKRYPASARMKRQEGVVSLRFTMNRDGHVLSFEIAKSSGSDALDKETLELIKRAEPLPAIPAAFGRDTLDLVVPVEFFLH
jgi:TonB family protein